ncbi:hypothetical protein LCGC14_1203200 [marine sediment metagenome]|uniref:Type-4 uracil-DNA glycosylase n=1 Tax=marine sediment metagenome TaxID=412755 RepID=A0A0F9NYN8_9ZZZZ
MSKLEFPSSYIKFNCTGCPLEENKIVWGQGNYKNKIMFIGEAPGVNEEKFGKPFVGRSGNLLNIMLEKAGLNRELFYVTNIVKCRPPNNRQPNDEEKLCCRSFLRLEITKIAPKLIVTLGSTATNAILFNRRSMKLIVGKLVKTKIDLYSYLVFPMYHPSYVLRSGITRDDYLIFFLKLKRVICKIYLTQYKRLRWLVNEICKK